MKQEDFNKIRHEALLLSAEYNVEPCYTLWNSFAENFPEEASLLEGTQDDCFGVPKNVPNFLRKLKEMCNAE